MPAERDGNVEPLLAVAHLMIAVLILPTAAFFGLWFAPVLIAGPVWLAGIGVRFLRRSPDAWRMARRTHLFAGPVAILLALYGLYAVRAGALSAADGGGLLSAFGYYPLTVAFGLAAVSAVTLVLSWREGRSEQA